MQTLNNIRSGFLDFFAGRGHNVVASAPLVPQNDPSLMFINAGMVPFKNVFTGLERRDYVRAASSQKCVRAGGKHNDLENVGYTARHHTFFEMLGNFSFGDYFKEDAIVAAWDLVTKEFGLDPEKLCVTIYHTDEDAFNLWTKIAGLHENKIIRIKTNDNFWSMGDTGPCGPCSEIFYDHGSHLPGGPPGSPNEDGDRFVEIWNLVFMQFERHEDGRQTDLPKPSIDTGMGLERIAAVMQGVHDNYETDLFRKLIAASMDITRQGATGDMAVAHRVVADHLRAAVFLLADGVAPSNEGRGYVLRRIMRRAMRYASSLKARTPLLAALAPTLISEMEGAYPELSRAKDTIVKTLYTEEEKFKSLLERGLKMLSTEVKKLPIKAPLSGEVAFKLYDTYGFPLDLTQDTMRREGRSVDVAAFDTAMAAQKIAARASWTGTGATTSQEIWFELQAEVGKTEFTGYTQDTTKAVVTAIVQDDKRVATAHTGNDVAFLVDQTPFYAESGGQVGDIGKVSSPDGVAILITDTQKYLEGMYVHRGRIIDGALKVGQDVLLEIDTTHREKIRANHSATHLLHAALRCILGAHVTQKGSQVTGDRLRFDFSHPQAVPSVQLAQVENDVNEQIRFNHVAETKIMPYNEAVDAGAIALFGEKYDDDVRVLCMGHDATTNRAYSVELCGGTHVTRLGAIGLFVIINESAVASGIRRIEALTGEAARRHLKEQGAQLYEAARILKTNVQNVVPRLQTLMEERRQLDHALGQAKKALALGRGGDDSSGSGHATQQPEMLGDIAFLGRILQDIPARELRSMVDEARATLACGVVAFITLNQGKAALTVGVTENLTNKISAVDLVKLGASAMGGKGGGGRPDMAQAGGPEGNKAQDAIDTLRNHLQNC